MRHLATTSLLGLVLTIGCGGADEPPKTPPPGNTGGTSGAGGTGDVNEEGTPPPVDGTEIETVAPMPTEGCPDGWYRYKADDGDALCWRAAESVTPEPDAGIEPADATPPTPPDEECFDLSGQTCGNGMDPCTWRPMDEECTFECRYQDGRTPYSSTGAEAAEAYAEACGFTEAE